MQLNIPTRLATSDKFYRDPGDANRGASSRCDWFYSINYPGFFAIVPLHSNFITYAMMDDFGNLMEVSATVLRRNMLSKPLSFRSKLDAALPISAPQNRLEVIRQIVEQTLSEPRNEAELQEALRAIAIELNCNKFL